MNDKEIRAVENLREFAKQVSIEARIRELSLYGVFVDSTVSDNDVATAIVIPSEPGAEARAVVDQLAQIISQIAGSGRAPKLVLRDKINISNPEET